MSEGDEQPLSQGDASPRVWFGDEEGVLTLYATARFKPETAADVPDDRERDEYGYVETDPQRAMVFPAVSPLEESLLREWIPLVVDKAGGFAGFRANATKTITLLDRLKQIQLPDLDDPETRQAFLGYLREKAEAERLDTKIERTDALIDELVYELYGLTDEEIAMVEGQSEVFVAPSRTRKKDVWHADVDCRVGPANPVERSVDEVDDFEPCGVCVTQPVHGDGGDRDHYQALDAAGDSELRTDGGTGTGEEDDRLFVPLKTEHYRRFENGTKDWELRGINDQFNLTTVEEGRAVELRRGYSTGDSLWGTIAEVRYFHSLTEIPGEIQEGINPEVSPSEFIEHAEGLLGQYENYVAFRPEGLNVA